jgi:hypothetical protein
MQFVNLLVFINITGISHYRNLRSFIINNIAASEQKIYGGEGGPAI